MTDKELSQQAKDYFAQIRKTDRLIQRLKGAVATLRSGLTGQSYELKSDKVQSSGSMNPLEDAMIKISDLENKIQNRIAELATMRNETFSMIQNVSDFNQQNVLIARYCEDKKWEKIAIELNFSISQIYKIHGAALLSFAKNNPSICKDDSKSEC